MVWVLCNFLLLRNTSHHSTSHPHQHHYHPSLHITPHPIHVAAQLFGPSDMEPGTSSARKPRSSEATMTPPKRDASGSDTKEPPPRRNAPMFRLRRLRLQRQRPHRSQPLASRPAHPPLQSHSSPFWTRWRRQQTSKRNSCTSGPRIPRSPWTKSSSDFCDSVRLRYTSRYPPLRLTVRHWL